MRYYNRGDWRCITKYIPWSQATSMYWPKTRGRSPRVLGQYMLVAWLKGMYFSDTPEVSPVVITLLSDHWKFKSLSLKIRWFISYSTGNSRNSWNQNKNTIVCIDGRLREFLKFAKIHEIKTTGWYVLKLISRKKPHNRFLLENLQLRRY